MPNPFNGSAKGKRGGRNRPSRAFVEPTHHNSNTARLPELGIYYDCYEDIERRSTHLIPRRSLTDQQHLGMFAPQIETETVKLRQLDKQTGKLVETTEQRQVWKSDKTLLKRGRPDQFGTDRAGTRYKVITPHSKRLTTQTERQNVVIETPNNPDIDEI